MKKLFLAIIISAFYLFGLAPTHHAVSADYKFDTGYDLYRDLRLGEKLTEKSEWIDICNYNHALGYIRGFDDGQPLKFPEGTTLGQVVLIFKKWAKNHPEKLHEPMGWCLWWALSEVYGGK